MGPGKGMAEGRFLAGLQGIKADHVVGEQVFVLKGQTHVVQPGVVGADGNIYPGLKAAVKDHFELVNFIQGAGFKIGGGAHLQTLPLGRHLPQQLGMPQRNLNAVANAHQVGQQLGMAAILGFVEVASGFQTQVQGR
jgi:hypothetical protein